MTINKATTNKSINYTVLEECGDVSERRGGYTLKLRYMQWNDRDPVYDLRPWKINDQGEEVCGKGITMTGEELEDLLQLLNS